MAVVAATLLASAAFVFLACDDQGLTDVPRYSSVDDGGNGTPTSTSDGAPGTQGDAGGADCAAAPRLRSNDRGFFCSFLRDGGSDAGPRNCGNDETCCNPAKVGTANPPTFCAATPRARKGLTDLSSCAAQAGTFGSDWSAGGTSWECADKNNCDTGKVCCMFTQAGATEKANVGPTTDKSIPASCNVKQGYKFGGTYCGTTCSADDVALCSLSDPSCDNGKKCVPFEIFQGSSADLRDLGYCN